MRWRFGGLGAATEKDAEMGVATKACPACAEQVEATAEVCRFCRLAFGSAPRPARGGAGVVLAVIVAVVVAVVLFGALLAIVLPPFLKGGRASNERSASASIKTLATAQADFRSNDRDNDGAANFWVRDIYGLYALCPSPDGKSVATPSVDQMIKLVEPSLAAAEGGGLGVGPGCVPVGDAVGTMSLKAGYAYMAMLRYETTTGEGEPYASNGNTAAMGKCYNFGKYGVMSAPEKLSHEWIFIMNEEITIWRIAVPPQYAGRYTPGRLEMSSAPIWQGAAFPRFPGGAGWSKLD